MKLRSLLTLALAAAFVFVAPITAKADEIKEPVQPKGWVQDSKGWWYGTIEWDSEKGEYVESYYKDGVFPCDDLKTPDVIEQDKYYFDKNGYMKKGWIQHTEKYESYYYDSETGKTKPCTQKNRYWIYTDKSGKVQTGWEKIDGEWYYFNIYNGQMYEDGTREIYPVKTEKYGDGREYSYYDYDAKPTLYHFTKDGDMTTGWYFHEYENGNGGTWYYSDQNGVVKTGWKKIAGVWYMFDKNTGAMQTSEGSYDPYYTGKSGYVSGQYYSVSGDYYYFKEDGAMVSGWYNYDTESKYGDWVFCKDNGKAYNGWLKWGSDWYYFDNGDMRESEYVVKYQDVKDANGNIINRKEVERYYMGKDGKMITGWYKISYDEPNYSSNSWKYAGADGKIKARWVKSGSDWYFVDSDGDMVRSGVYKCETKSDKAPVRGDYDSTKDYNKAVYKYNLKHRYVFDDEGKLVTSSWYKFVSSEGTRWYYADANGNAYNGWLKDGGNWYFLSYGRMLTNQYVDGGYWVGADGVWR